MLFEPAEKAAVNYRDAVDKQQVSKPKGAGLFVEDRQIGIGMGRAVCPENKPPFSEIEFQPARNQHGRRHNLAPISLIAEGFV